MKLISVPSFTKITDIKKENNINPHNQQAFRLPDQYSAHLRSHRVPRLHNEYFGANSYVYIGTIFRRQLHVRHIAP